MSNAIVTEAPDHGRRRASGYGAGGNRARSDSSGTTGVLWWVGQIASWLVLLIILAVAVVMIVIPRLGGATAYTVLTGSMEPGMPPGSLAVVRPVDPFALRTGDVITYQLESGEPAVVTHRVVGVGSTLNGGLRIASRGDANTADDPPVRAEQIRGRLWYQVPWLGYINSALTGTQRQWLTLIAVTGLLGYAVVMSVSAWRDWRGRHGPRTQRSSA